jgi:hypothetical protein
MGIILGLGAPIGPVVGGSVSHVLNWRWCLLINVPVVGITGFIIFFLMLPKTKKAQMVPYYVPPRRRVAWASIFSVIPTIVIFMVSLDTGGVEHTDTSAKILFLPMVGIIWWALCALVEHRVSHGAYSVITLSLLKQPGAVVCLLYALLHSFSINAAPFFMSHYFHSVQGFSAIMNAVHLLPFFLTSGLIWFAVDRLLFRGTGPRPYFQALVAGHALMLVGFGLYLDLGADYDIARIIGYQAVTAMGGTLAFTATLGVLEQDLPDAELEPAGNAIDFMRAMSMVLALGFGGLALMREMHAQYPELLAKLGGNERIAELVTGFEDTANMEISRLSPDQQLWVRNAIVRGMRRTWLVLLGMVALAALFLPLIWLSNAKRARQRHQRAGLPWESL